MPLSGLKASLVWPLLSVQLLLLSHTGVKLVKSQLPFAAYGTPSGEKAIFSSRYCNPIILKELGVIHETRPSTPKQLRQKQTLFLSILYLRHSFGT